MTSREWLIGKVAAQIMQIPEGAEPAFLKLLAEKLREAKVSRVERTYEIGSSRGDAFILCHVCGKKSFNPNDIASLYCGNCHEFHDREATTGDRTDRVELKGGVANLPAEFREVARLANVAGLEGYELVDAEIGLDVEEARRVLAHPSFDSRMDAMNDGLKSRMTLTYRHGAK